MKKKIVSILSICALGIAGFAYGYLQSTQVSALETPVYVSSCGSDNGVGTDLSPYATLDKALTEIADGGTIILKDTVAVNGWTAHGKSVTITGGTLNVSGVAEVEINDSVTFTNINLQVDTDAYVYVNGYKTTMGTGVSWTNEIRLFGGGKEGSTVDSTNLTVLSGTYTHIYGGSYKGTVAGDTNLTVAGTVNNTSAVDTAIKNHSDKYYVYGGGYVDTVQGKTNVTVSENMKAVYVYGGSYGWGSKIAKGANLTVSGGTIMGVFGGTKGADSGSSTYTYIEGGHMQQVFGGNENFTLTGDSDLRIVGGTVTRRIYAGCYGDGSKNYLVSGKVNLELGGDVNITLNENHDDKGIYARSRYKGDAENCQIVFTSQMAYDTYKNKLGSSDWGSSYVMGSMSVADECHYYAYSVEDNVITQTCAYHNTLSATVTIGLDESISLQYMGNAITPVELDYSADWEYDKPTVVYSNNVECGKANYTVTAGPVSVEGSFIIVKTPVVFGGSVRLFAPSGLRFQSKIPTELRDSGAKFGTLVIPKSVLGANELTVDTPNVDNIEQTKWATDAVKKDKPAQYENGYEYFNAVLTEIPEEAYDEMIVARSYVYANGQYYYSAPIERSVAQVSAYALQDGYTNEILCDYVDKALADSTLSMQTTVTIFEGETCALTLSGNKGYVAIWSTDSDIISVDNSGKVTAGKTEGEAVVTAKLGNITVKCTVIVKQRWTEYY